MTAQTVGVICEVNPLHGGHAYILEKARAQAGNGCVLAVMSGNFVQRGSCAVFDKYTRADALLSAGADLVLELPFPWCSASAAYFADAGVQIAAAGGAQALCFGSECGDIRLLSKAVETLSSEAFRIIMQKTQKEDGQALGEAAVRMRALAAAMPDIPTEILQSPNDILGLAYLPACNRFGITAVAEKRLESDGLFSAKDIRRTIEAENWQASRKMVYANAVKRYDSAIGEGRGPVSETGLQDRLWEILSVLGDRLPVAAECGGGVRNRLLRCAAESVSGDDFFARVATKKYTNARLRRAALFLVCGVTESLLKQPPAYTTLLAANGRGRAHLADCRRMGGLPILTKPADRRLLPEEGGEQATVSQRADALFVQCMPCAADTGYFLRQKPQMR